MVSSKCPISQCQYSAAASTDTGSVRLDTTGLAGAQSDPRSGQVAFGGWVKLLMKYLLALQKNWPRD